MIKDLLEVFLKNGFTKKQLVRDVLDHPSTFRADILQLAEDLEWLDTGLINELNATNDSKLLHLIRIADET